MKSFTPRTSNEQRGIALIVVLLTLLALFALCVPFLWLASSVDEASARLVDRTRARLALDDAAQHARLALSATHPSIDPDRDFDSPLELSAPWDFDRSFYDPLDEEGVMWGHEVHDLAGRVDLGSVSPQLLANLLGLCTYTTQAVTPESETVQVADATGFPDAGYLYIAGEFVAYDRSSGNGFTELTRGLFNNGTLACGPLPPRSHDIGTTVIGIEAVTFAQWRMARGMEAARAMGFGELGEELRGMLPPVRIASDAEPDDGPPGLPQDPLREMALVLDRTATLYGDIAATRRWQQPVRVNNDLFAGQSCVLDVESPRWFAPGSTVRIRGDGGVEEFALVRYLARGSAVVLEDPVRNNYTGRRTQIEVLSRRPVNLNTASRDVLLALFENLSLLGTTARVNSSEASKLADYVIEMRPFEGFDDFLERLVLPAAGIPLAEEGESNAAARARNATAMVAFIDLDDAVALYKNARNANDSDLSFATAPFAFVSRDLFSIDLRASLNVESKRERFSTAREQIEWVAPAGELLHVWGRQEDFDEELRLDRAAPGWISGPNAVTIFDSRFGADPPPRTLAHLAISRDSAGDEGPVSRSIFASDDASGFVKPWASRTDEAGPRQGRVRHFDRSRSDLEGRDLAQDPLNLDPTGNPASWADQTGLLGAGGASFWFKYDAPTGHLFDSGTGSPENDRLRAFFENGELVLEVLDATGDHPDTTFEERGRLTLPLAGSPVTPGVWSHLEFDVRGNRADQMSMRVDGFGFGRPQSSTHISATGRTFLTTALTGSATQISVESTEDFPDRCVLLVGNELIEATKSGPNSFDAQHVLAGELAGFGGRLARELHQYQLVGDTVEFLNEGLAVKTGSYPVGTQVLLYGYSAPLSSAVPPGRAELDGAIGPFSVARVVGVKIGASTGLGRPIAFHSPALGLDIPIGRGFDVGEAPPEALDLGPCDSNQSATDAARGFSPSGGYALLLQRRVSFTIAPGPGTTGDQVDEPMTPARTPLFGLQVFRYGGLDGTLLVGLDWAIDDSVIPSLAGDYQGLGELGVPRAFVTEYGGLLLNPDRLNQNLRAQIICVPISLPCGANQIDFLEANPVYGANFPADVANERGEFAQLTHTDTAELTEWLRYDFIVNGDFVRAAPSAFLSLYNVIVAGQEDDIDVNPGGGTPGGGGGGSGGGGGGGATTSVTVAVGASTLAPAPLAQPLVEPAAANTPPLQYWSPELGENELLDLPFTRALSDAFQFRGVLATHSHAHPAGTEVLPVWRVADPREGAPDRGWLGRLDPVFAISDDLGDPGQAALVHRTWRAVTAQNAPVVPQVDWTPGPNLTANAGPTTLGLLFGVEWNQVQLVALDRAIGLPYLPDPTPMRFGEVRQRNRISKFPSGERPRLAPGLVFGTNLSGGESSGIVIDELVFHGGVNSSGGQNFRFLLLDDVDAEQTRIPLVPNEARTAWGVLTFAGPIVGQLPADSGLFMIGRELIAYQSYDEATGEFEVSEGGRGMLGTDAGPHARSESVIFLPAVTIGTLSNGIGAGDDYLALDDPGAQLTGTRDFPFAGTVLVGDEMIHHTFRDDNGLGMPRASSEAGRDDFRGDALFRGRFGTLPQSHPAGTAVVRFPYRYWDRWTTRADAPELHHFDIQLSQPDAFLQGIFFEQDGVPEATVRLGVLQRTDSRTPWDADPLESPDLELVFVADPKDGLHPVGRQIDRVEWRVFVEYLAGAFDPIEGLSTGWKQAPSLQTFGAQYLAPGRIVARRQR